MEGLTSKSLKESELFAGQLKYPRFSTLGDNEVHQMPISLFMADIQTFPRDYCIHKGHAICSDISVVKIRNKIVL